MKIKRDRVILTIILMGIGMILFSATLNTMSYRKLQADTVAHAGILNTTSAVRKLNYALSFGKPINKFYGLDGVMEGITRLSYDINGVEIIDGNEERVEAIGDIDEPVRRTTPDEEYVIRSDGLYAFVDFDGGEIVLKFDKGSIEASTKEYMGYIFRISSYVMLGVVISAFLFCFIHGGGELSVKRMRVSSIIILVVSQCVLGALAMARVDAAFSDSMNRIAVMTARSVENDINEVINKGVKYEEISGLDEYLDDLAQNIPELDRLELKNVNGTVTENAGSHYISIEGLDDKSLCLNCYYSTDFIKRKRINNAIDIIILILIAIFMSMEAVKFLTNNMEYRDTRARDSLYIPGFRLFVFAQGIAFALDAGFFSVYSDKMFEASGLPETMSFLSGMPKTMYSAAVLIGLFGCSTLIDKLGMKKTLSLGLISGVTGYILCAIAPDLSVLVLARFIFGFCDGIVINAIRLYAAAQESKEMHNRLLVEYMAAIYLGISCGVVIGGLIADVSTYAVVFIVGAAIGAFCLFLMYYAGFPENSKKEKLSFAIALKQLRFPQVRIFMLFVVIPLYMASLFVEYTFPLFGDEVNLSNSIVSGLLMLNYMILAYLTDPISDWVIKRVRTRWAMLAYMILQTISIGLFALTSSLIAAILAIIFTSVWDCFGLVVIDSALDHVEGTVTEQSTLLQMVFGKLAMMIGPLAITARLSQGAAGATRVIIVALVIGIIVYSCSILYFKRKEGKSAEGGNV